MIEQVKNSNLENLIEAKESLLAGLGYLEFNEDELVRMDEEEVKIIESHFHGRAMMRLPEKEIAFFIWLKKNDRPVWDDLWKDEPELYHVSIDFLHHFTKSGNGFPICDLVQVDNYWFHTRHIKPKGVEKTEEIGAKISKDATLTFEETFLTEVIRGSIDVWHFCHHYQVPVNVAKKKLDEMHLNDLLVHLTEREDLLKYLDI